ncbi:MAG: 8-amino-7-oxononanoate synthase [Gammaproteobacteria bacterium]
MSNPLLARVTQTLHGARRAGLLRRLEAHEGAQGPTIVIGGRRLANFTSNDYLGMAADPRVIARVRDALPAHGVGSGAAALLSGRCTVHVELEQRLARLTGFPAGLLFSSGYLANLGALPALAARGDFVAHDRLNHASLVDAVLASGAGHRRYAHGDLTAADGLLAAAAADVRFLVTESVYSMDGDIADLERCATIAAAHEATLYVDDAHGFGVYGAGGRGAAAALSCSTHQTPTVLMLTFGKALGAAGAIVLADASVIEFLVQRARTFVYDTALPPICAIAVLATLDVLETDAAPRQRLQDNIALFRRLAGAAGLPLLPSATPIQPLMVGSPERALTVAAAVQQAGFYVRAIRPPTVPRGTARIRITLSATHDRPTITRLVETLATAAAAAA